MSSDRCLRSSCKKNGLPILTCGLVHPNANCQQEIGVALLIGGLDGQNMVRCADGFVEGPLLDRFQSQREPCFFQCLPILGPNGRIVR